MEKHLAEKRSKTLYLELSHSLRDDIASGRIGPGEQLPSEAQLCIRHGVSRSVAKRALGVLKEDSLAFSIQGAGVFVRSQDLLPREQGWPGLLPLTDNSPQMQWPPPVLDTQVWKPDPPMFSSEEEAAGIEIAQRLAVEPGHQVLRILCRYKTLSAKPDFLLVTSWRPIFPPGRTVEQPDELCEQIVVRGATPDEIMWLNLPQRGTVQAVTRIHTAAGMPIETADIVMASDRCSQVYRMPIQARSADHLAEPPKAGRDAAGA